MGGWVDDETFTHAFLSAFPKFLKRCFLTQYKPCESFNGYNNNNNNPICKAPECQKTSVEWLMSLLATGQCAIENSLFWHECHKNSVAIVV